MFCDMPCVCMPPLVTPTPTPTLTVWRLVGRLSMRTQRAVCQHSGLLQVRVFDRLHGRQVRDAVTGGVADQPGVGAVTPRSCRESTTVCPVYLTLYKTIAHESFS